MNHARRILFTGLLAGLLIAGGRAAQRMFEGSRSSSGTQTDPETARRSAAARLQALRPVPQPAQQLAAVLLAAQASTPSLVPFPPAVSAPLTAAFDRKVAGADGKPLGAAAVVAPYTKTSEVILILKPGIDPADVAKKYALRPLRPIEGNPLAWVFGTPSVEAAEGARLAARSDPRVTTAQNNRLLHLSKFAFVPNDPYYPAGSPAGFPGQWHLVNSNLPAAWNKDVTGLGVTLAIVDDGCDFVHEDLAGNFSATHSRNFAATPPNSDYGPNVAYDGDPNIANNHGTAVSGVAAAVGGNGIGVTGAAPRSTFGINRLDFVVGQPEANLAAAAMFHAVAGDNAIKVKNHSYGFNVPYIDSSIEQSGVVTSAGAGTIHVYAAGNYRLSVGEDSNKMLPQNSPEQICVAALGSDNRFASYSNFGACVFVTAPSSSSAALDMVTTTDRTGAVGYSPSADPFPNANYTSTFGGTSSAAPLVAGILALGKQANPALTVRMAQHALARSADLVDASDSDTRSGGDGVTAGSAWKTNAAGFHFNQSYGFGVINADKFIAEAVKYTGVTESSENDADTFNEVIPDNNAAGVTKTFTLGSTTPVTYIRVSLDLNYVDFRGDLEAFVTSPSGTVCRLFRRSGDGGPFPDPDWTFNAWTFTSLAFWGENPSGTWTIRVVDVFAGDNGTWTGYNFTAHQGLPVFDNNPPSVSSVNRAGANPTNANPIVYTVKFNEWVTGVNSTDFTLTTTGTVAGASIVSVTGGIDTYTVTVNPGTGEGTIRLDVLDDDSIVDGNGNPLGGGFTSGQTYTVDRVAPTITVTSATANGGYTANAQIDITLTFSKPLTLAGGNLQVTLDTGAVLVFTPFSAQGSVSAVYTVAPGDTSMDLNVVSPLVLTSGTLRDAFGNNAVLTIPAGSNLAMFRAIVVDAIGPTSGTVFDGFAGADIDVQSSITTVSAHWSGFTDLGSGIAGYRWAIGTNPGSTNIQAYTDVGMATQASTSMANQTLSLTPGTNYFVTVEVRDGVGVTSITTSDGFQVVAGGVAVPLPPARLDALAQSATSIQAVWPASPTAGVTYRLWHKTATQPWTDGTLVDNIAGLSTTVGGLTIGTVYDFQVRAVLPGGNESSGVFASGSPANPITINGLGNYANIPAAIAAAVSGDTITVQAGTYSVNLSLPAGITLTGVSPHFTILQANNAAADVITATGTVPPSTVSQMTIRGGLEGVDAGNATLLLRNLIIRTNSSNGVSSLAGSTLQVINCTIAHNGGAGVLAAGTTTVRNTIATGNGGLGISAPAAASVTYSDSYANTGAPYSAGITASTAFTTPATFADEPGHDYTETLDSFSVDHGDPNDAYALEPDYNGGRINLGAFGNTSRAATSPAPPPSGGGGGGGGGCGLTGLEGVLLLLFRRRRR